MFNDTREPLAEVASQLLVVLLDQNSEQTPTPVTENSSEEGVLEQTPEVTRKKSLMPSVLPVSVSKSSFVILNSLWFHFYSLVLKRICSAIIYHVYIEKRYANIIDLSPFT